MSYLRRVSVTICVYLAAALVLPSTSFGFDRTIQQYVHTSWGYKEGAPSGILALAQTRDGYLWIGTVDGLYRFDGVSFELYRPGIVYALFSSPNGDLWVGLNAAILLLQDGKEITYSGLDGVPNGKIASFASGADGTIWVATNVGLARLAGNRWTTVGQDWNFPGKFAMGMCLDRNGTLWVATDNTIVYLPQGSHHFRATGLGTKQVWMIVEAPNRRLWIAETNRSVRPLPMGGNLPPSDKTEIVTGSIGILFDRDGSLWITTIGLGMRHVSHPNELGAQSYKDPDSKVDIFTTEQGLTDNMATSILQDREGNVWVGTNSGLDCFRKGALVPFTAPFRLVQPILGVGDRGDLWVVSQNHLWQSLLHISQSGDVTLQRTSDSYLRAYSDRRGTVWWSAPGAVYRQKDGQVTRLPPKGQTAPFSKDARLTEDKDGVLWAAAQYADIFSLKDQRWAPIETPREITQLDCTAAFTDWTGRVWFGFQAGGAIVTVEDARVKVLAASGKSPVGNIVTAIQGQAHHIWIGGSGLVYFEGGAFHPVVPYDGIGLKVWGIREISDGSLWLAENRGVVHIPSSEVKRFLADYNYRVQYELFDSADGLPGSFHDAAARSREVEGTDGRLWFATTQGIAWLDPTEISRNTVPPPTSIRFVEADGRRYEPVPRLSLPPRVANLTIAYAALSLSVPSRVRYRYQLEGVDPGWQDPGTRREAFYTRLAPGNYQFHVIACNNDGVWNQQGATLAFSIAPAWFQTIWFRILCIASAALAILIAYRLRVRQIARAMTVRFNERLDERTRIAQDLHDTFLQTIQGSQLVADNALDHIDDQAQTRHALEQISEFLARAAREGRYALQALRSTTTETNDLAAALRRSLEDCRREQPMETEFSAAGDPRELHPVVRDEVYRIGYEAIRNACVHSAASRLDVVLNYTSDLSLRVSDNGVGIDREFIAGRGGHFGLQGMHERAARIGARLTISSSADAGTKVELNVPGRIVFRAPRLTAIEKMRNLFNRSNRG